MNGTLRFKVGLPFAMLVAIDAPHGGVADLTGCTYAAQIRDALGTLVASPAVTAVLAQPGAVQLTVQDTTQWPFGQMWCDLNVTWPNGLTTPTEPWMITILRGVTR
ncbi:hypothetical protein [Acetobacter sp. DsW_063]|uniref:hypothetical protein n=1 Tax=Acetobacter sp. DsW_063 TaxID=1514894 RepID=UPI000A3785C7|nr:hypothetical protein [Acetobacter sp. DsW_063]OUJ14204.1 hypothetical protein HK28_00550 [Acetobacter sp. DsW_063]